MGLFSMEDKFLKRAKKLADKTELLRTSYMDKTDEELRGLTSAFRERHKSGESLESLMPEVFAQVREAGRRVLGMEHFHVQLVGGAILHYGDIAEMKTGEGKTLVATLPACLNALAGPVHIVTVNDYLAKRDSEWMGLLYKFLGYSVGLVLKDMDTADKKESYMCDIVYATNNELGFDYLRDNMVVYKENRVQGELTYAIVDEVDSILIDEARTPLIISGAGEESTKLYSDADRFVRTNLKLDEDFILDEKQKTANLTEDGIKKAEEYFGVENFSDVENTDLNHHVYQALKAHHIMKLDTDYVVQDGEVVIVDEFTGRLMTGRRYSEGLHQAIEAKEGVRVERESKTLATITFQNFFRMYKKLSGMTGTAQTEEAEFRGIYNLGVVQVPTHRKMVRKDLNDVILPTVESKFRAVVEEIQEVHKTGQPILVGTVSVEKSETLSKMLKKQGVKHEVLNAKQHEKEALIVAQAGKFGAVTIATNMAGRGTDILLGGNPDFMAKSELKRLDYSDYLIHESTSHAETQDPEILEVRAKYSELHEKYQKETSAEHEKVVEVGGLHIIGTERHESRRIDNQLRGRSGRQGDPGCSHFYISLEDDLMRLFGGDRIKMVIDKLSGGEDMPLEYGMLTKQIEKAQKRIEQRNFDIRSHVLKYDDVMNKQREVIYEQRSKVLTGEDLHDSILAMIENTASSIVNIHCTEEFPEEWNKEQLNSALMMLSPEIGNVFDGMDLGKMEASEARQQIITKVLDLYSKREEELTSQGADMRELERVILLRAVDSRWMDHIDDMDQLRQGIGLRAYGQVDPVVAYRKEGADMFDEMISNIERDTASMLLRVRIESRVEHRETAISRSYDDSSPSSPIKRTERKVGRNDPCPCGSNKKYKNCCGS